MRILRREPCTGMIRETMGLLGRNGGSCGRGKPRPAGAALARCSQVGDAVADCERTWLVIPENQGFNSKVLKGSRVSSCAELGSCCAQTSGWRVKRWQIPARLSAYGEWSVCTTSCGSGLRTRQEGFPQDHTFFLCRFLAGPGASRCRPVEVASRKPSSDGAFHKPKSAKSKESLRLLLRPTSFFRGLARAHLHCWSPATWAPALVEALVWIGRR